MKAADRRSEVPALAARAGMFTLPLVVLVGGLCAFRWGWQSGLAILAGALLGGLCLLAHALLTALMLRPSSAGTIWHRRRRGALAGFLLLKMLLIVTFLGAALCWLRLPAAELAVGYTVTLVVLACLGLANSRCRAGAVRHAR